MPRESNVYDAATHDNVRRRATIMTMCFRACYKRILMRAKYSLCKKMAKVWTVVPLSVAGGGEAASPSNTMWPCPRPTSIPSGILNPYPSNRLVTTHQHHTQIGQTDRTTTAGPIA